MLWPFWLQVAVAVVIISCWPCLREKNDPALFESLFTSANPSIWAASHGGVVSRANESDQASSCDMYEYHR